MRRKNNKLHKRVADVSKIMQVVRDRMQFGGHWVSRQNMSFKSEDSGPSLVIHNRGLEHMGQFGLAEPHL